MHMSEGTYPQVAAQIYIVEFGWLNLNCTFRANLHHSQGKFSRRQIDSIFLIFSRKQDLTFHANCLHGDNLHEMSSPVSWEK